MQFVSLLILALSVGLSVQFNTSFDYLQQGTDWNWTWPNCNTTNDTFAYQQSPIAINSTNTTLTKQFAGPHYWFPFYKPILSDVNFYNVSCVITPHDNTDDEGFGKVYGGLSDFNHNQLKTVNITIHSPAEHILDGVQHPIEVQIYHEVLYKYLTTGRVVVTSIFFTNVTSSESSEFLANVTQAKVKGESTATIDLSTLFDSYRTILKEMYSYIGTYTFPECDVKITRGIFPEPYSASSEEIQAIWDLYHNNPDFAGSGNNRAVFEMNHNSQAVVYHLKGSPAV